MRISDWSSYVCSSDLVDAATRLTNRANDTCGLQAMLGCCLDIAVGLGQFEIAVDQSPGGNARHLGFCVPHLAIHKVGVGGSAKEIGRASCRERVCQYV